jgi:hypothetical protein
MTTPNREIIGGSFALDVKQNKVKDRKNIQHTPIIVG